MRVWGGGSISQVLVALIIARISRPENLDTGCRLITVLIDPGAGNSVGALVVLHVNVRVIPGRAKRVSDEVRGATPRIIELSLPCRAWAVPSEVTSPGVLVPLGKCDSNPCDTNGIGVGREQGVYRLLVHPGDKTVADGSASAIRVVIDCFADLVAEVIEDPDVGQVAICLFQAFAEGTSSVESKRESEARARSFVVDEVVLDEGKETKSAHEETDRIHNTKPGHCCDLGRAIAVIVRVA